jgi:predicted transcriptional regulator
MGGSCKTKIVYLANLNFKTVNPYLEDLLANGLLEEIDGPLVRYKTTEKGEILLDCMTRIDQLMPLRDPSL